MWLSSLLGALVAATLGISALLRSRRPKGIFDGDVYGMTRVVHRRYMYAGWILAVLCLASLWWPPPTLPLLTVVALLAILYFSSFLRGAESDD